MTVEGKTKVETCFGFVRSAEQTRPLHRPITKVSAIAARYSQHVQCPQYIADPAHSRADLLDRLPNDTEIAQSFT